MSHVVKLATEFRSIPTLEKVCQKKRIPIEVAREGQKLRKRLYGTDVEGVAAFNLPDWRYPVVVAQNGEAKCDNYGGHWGPQEHLDDLTKDYAKELVTDKLRAQGFRQVSETVDQEGAVELLFVE